MGSDFDPVRIDCGESLTEQVARCLGRDVASSSDKSYAVGAERCDEENDKERSVKDDGDEQRDQGHATSSSMDITVGVTRNRGSEQCTERAGEL